MIFNSLGSNYSFSFALKALFTIGTGDDKRKLRIYLEKRYQGKVVLLYKGREAIKMALKILDLPPNSKVGITGFTCYAVYQAIKELNLTPIYLDIDQSLNFPAQEIGKVRVLIVQNTLGNPCDMENIAKICKAGQIILVEDLAHSIGTVYKGDQEAGTVGDFTALSFSQDKAVDAVSGGALVIRNPKYVNHDIGPLKKLGLTVRLKDRFYPVLTFKIRNLYPFGMGKPLHYILKQLNLLSKPIETDKEISLQSMPNWYSKLLNSIFDEFDSTLKHRQKIAAIYARRLDQKIVSKKYIGNINLSGCLRFPIFVEDRQSLINYLKTRSIFISDIWYDAPIAPSRRLADSDYRGECPYAEKIAKEILNLPTHINVASQDAEYISDQINTWLNTQ